MMGNGQERWGTATLRKVYLTAGREVQENMQQEVSSRRLAG